MAGSYKLECYNPEGLFARTDNIFARASHKEILNSLYAACPWLEDRIDILEDTGKPYY